MMLIELIIFECVLLGEFHMGEWQRESWEIVQSNTDINKSEKRDNSGTHLINILN